MDSLASAPARLPLNPPGVAAITRGPMAGATLAPFSVMLGMQFFKAEDGVCEAALPAREDLVNRRGVMHGGVIAALVDTSMALAMRSLDPTLESRGTVDLNIHFVAPGQGGLEAVARVRRAGGSLAFCQCDVVDAAGTLVATAMGSFMLRRARAA